MATQTVEFTAGSGLSLTLKLYAEWSDTETDSASATEATNRKGVYTAAFTDVAAGWYRAIAYSGSTPVAEGWVKLKLVTGTYGAVADRVFVSDFVEEGDVDGFSLQETLRLMLAACVGKLSGAATTTVTIRAADDSKDRVVATVDADGNRSAVTLTET